METILLKRNSTPPAKPPTHYSQSKKLPISDSESSQMDTKMILFFDHWPEIMEEISNLIDKEVHRSRKNHEPNNMKLVKQENFITIPNPLAKFSNFLSSENSQSFRVKFEPRPDAFEIVSMIPNTVTLTKNPDQYQRLWEEMIGTTSESISVQKALAAEFLETKEYHNRLIMELLEQALRDTCTELRLPLIELNLNATKVYDFVRPALLMLNYRPGLSNLIFENFEKKIDFLMSWSK